MIAAILCAAGKGVRAGFSENKVLRDLNGLPVLCHCLCAFAPYTDEILIACAPEDEPRIRALLAPYPTARTVLGGMTAARAFITLCERQRARSYSSMTQRAPL